MLLRSEAKVGLIVFIGIVALIMAYWFLGGWSLRSSSYPIYALFSDARTLDKGADVRMAGVKIGWVNHIELTRTSKARVDMDIRNGNDIPIDSAARITTGGFIGDNYIEILPGSSKKYLTSGSRIKGGQLIQFDQLLVDIGELLKELKISAVGINELLGDKEIVATVKETVEALKSAAESASELVNTADDLIARSSPEIQNAFTSLAAATDSASRIARDFEDILVQDAKPNMDLILSEAGDAMTNLKDSMADAGELIADMRTGAATANEALLRLATVAEQANEMMERLNDAAGGIRDLATDQQLQSDLRKTARNTAEATEQAKHLMYSLNRKFGGLTSGPSYRQKSAIPQYGPSVDTLWNTNRGKYRFDANYTFAGAGPSFYRIGAYNIGENTRLNLQGGTTLDQKNAVRYGLYASRVALGYSFHSGDTFSASADLFRPNDPELELRGVFGLGAGFGLYGGVADVFDKDKRDVLAGIRYNK